MFLSKVVPEVNNVRDGTVASTDRERLLKSTTRVVPYPVTLSPVPTKLISVNPTPILGSIIPECGLSPVDPTPIPPPGLNSSPSLKRLPRKLISCATVNPPPT